MYRNIILEFLSTKHLELAKAESYQLTICALGHNYGDNLIKLTNNEDEISIYHIKEPRVYEKIISFNDLTNNLLMMAFELKSEIRFKKSELDFVLKDPFYLKDLSNQDFNSLLVTPIFDKDDMVGALITYFKSDNGYVKYTNNELLKLLHTLDIDKAQEYNDRVYKKIINEPSLMLVAYGGKQIYINDIVKNYLKAKSNIISQSDLKMEKDIKNLVNTIGFKKQAIEDLTIYYIETTKLNPVCEDNMDILALQSLNKHSFKGKFTYLLVRKSLLSSTDIIINELQNLKTKLGFESCKIYEYNDETFIMLFDELLSNKIEIQIKEYLVDNYVILLDSSKDITSKMNLASLSKYLYEEQPEQYVKENYVDWMNKKNTEKLSYDDKYNVDKLNFEVVSSLDGHLLTKMVVLPLKPQYRDAHFLSYERVAERLLITLAQKNDEKLMITLTPSLLNKRKTYEDIKKIILNNELWINVIVKGNEDSAQFLKVMSKYKKLKVMLSCDSSVYLNYFYMNALPLFDGLYVQQEEYEHIRNEEVGFPQLIFDYAIKQYKYLIFENFNPDQEKDYSHFNCYFVNNRK